jgi:hypothetical protein
MASDPKAKPPPPEIIVEGDWPLFLRHPTDPYERARRAQQTADEQRERERERERELANKQQTVRAREGKAVKRRRVKEIVMRVAEAAAVKKTPWQVAGNELDQVNKHLRLNRLDEMDRHAIYYIIRTPSNWSRLTSLRKR